MSPFSGIRSDRSTLSGSKLLAVAAIAMLALLVLPAAQMAHALNSTPSVTLSNGITGAEYLAFDQSGNLWVSDDSGAILEYSAPFSSSSSPVNYVIDPSGCSHPYGIAFDSSGDLWVADNCTGDLYEYTAPFSPSSTPAVDISTPAECPYGIAVGPSDSVWVADPCGGYIFGYTGPFSGESIPSYAIPVEGCPTAVAFDSSGDLWYTDGCLDTASDLGQSPYSSIVQAVDTTPGCPQGITFDSSGDLWVTDYCYGSVQEFASPFTGSAITTLGSPIEGPNGIAFDSAGNLWIADDNVPAVFEYSSQLPAPPHVSLPPVIPQHVTVNFNFANAPTLTGDLVSLYGTGQVLYNVPGYNAATDIFPYVISTCSDAADNTVQISGFFSTGPGLNSTEILVSNWQSFSSSAAGWPTEPACSG